MNEHNSESARKSVFKLINYFCTFHADTFYVGHRRIREATGLNCRTIGKWIPRLADAAFITILRVGEWIAEHCRLATVYSCVQGVYSAINVEPGGEKRNNRETGIGLLSGSENKADTYYDSHRSKNKRINCSIPLSDIDTQSKQLPTKNTIYACELHNLVLKRRLSRERMNELRIESEKWQTDRANKFLDDLIVMDKDIIVDGVYAGPGKRVHPVTIKNYTHSNGPYWDNVIFAESTPQPPKARRPCCPECDPKHEKHSTILRFSTFNGKGWATPYWHCRKCKVSQHFSVVTYNDPENPLDVATTRYPELDAMPREEFAKLLAEMRGPQYAAEKLEKAEV